MDIKLAKLINFLILYINLLTTNQLIFNIKSYFKLVLPRDIYIFLVANLYSN
jgi:hypothetical protein